MPFLLSPLTVLKLSGRGYPFTLRINKYARFVVIVRRSIEVLAWFPPAILREERQAEILGALTDLRPAIRGCACRVLPLCALGGNSQK